MCETKVSAISSYKEGQQNFNESRPSLSATAYLLIDGKKKSDEFPKVLDLSRQGRLPAISWKEKEYITTCKPFEEKQRGQRKNLVHEHRHRQMLSMPGPAYYTEIQGMQGIFFRAEYLS